MVLKMAHFRKSTDFFKKFPPGHDELIKNMAGVRMVVFSLKLV